MSTTTVWILIGAIALATAAIKAAGPVLLGGRDLPPRTAGVVKLMPPVLLAALVVTSTFAEGSRIQVDAATAGVAVAGVMIWRRMPLLLAVLVAAGVTAGLRALA